MAVSKGVILAVDDEPTNLMILEHCLHEHGYEVITAEDGCKGLVALEKDYQSIKLVLLDRMMPNMNGVEMLCAMKKNTVFSKIPVIMQTAVVEKNQVQEFLAMDLDVTHYLIKPFREEKLIEMVEKVLGKNDA